MSQLQLNIISPEKSVFQGEIEQVTLPGVLGSFTILPHHAPIISSLQPGKLSYVSGGAESSLVIEGGIVEMSNGVVDVCVELSS